MKRLKGPELKKPDVRVPSFLADVYYDLRDRRLLPLVALVVVAIAAAPFLLDSSEEPATTAATPQSPAEAAEAETADASHFAVVEAKPGLRDYRKRLRRQSPTNPFKQRYTSLPEDAQLESTEVSTVSDGGGGGEASVTVDAGGGGYDGTVASPGPKPPGSTPPGARRGNRPDGLEGKRLFGFRPDIRFGVAGSGDLKLHEDVPLGSLLPKQNAVVLFVGITQNGERALFSIAPDIVVRGEGGCVGGVENCRFLSMRAGDAVDLLTGAPGHSFRLKVESIDFVELDLPPRSKRAAGSRATEKPATGRVQGLSAVGQFEE
jgi:hypothetical protein